VFAVMARTGRSSPRVFALRGRDAMLGQLQQAARKKLAMSINSEWLGHACMQEQRVTQLRERWRSNRVGGLLQPVIVLPQLRNCRACRHFHFRMLQHQPLNDPAVCLRSCNSI
jgi:hypothetical protein